MYGSGGKMTIEPIVTQYNSFLEYVQECINNGVTVKYEEDKFPLLKNQVEIISQKVKLEK
jgi:hypothetical protein